MIPPDLLASLRAIVGADRLHLDAPLAPYTTFRVGGPADCLVDVRGAEELIAVARAARSASQPLTIFGGGSNTIVSDGGVRGVVVRVHGGEIREESPGALDPGTEAHHLAPLHPSTDARGVVSNVEPHRGRHAPSSALRDGAPPPAEWREPAAVFVRADAGVTMNALVRWTIGRGFAGLETWAGTPGTVGGAICGNAHYAGRTIEHLVSTVQFLEADGRDVLELERRDLDFSYDHSRFLGSGEVVLSVVFLLQRGADPARLREVAHGSLAHRKRTQPLNVPSAGCIFQNPNAARDRVPPDIPCSAGALVDRAGLKGRRIGGALVSPTHANFIVSDGRATAAEIRALVRLCQAEVKRQFGVDLREEVRWVGEFENGSRHFGSC